MFLSCRPFIVITLSRDLVGFEVTSIPTRPVENVVITTKGLQDRNIHILDGTTVENKGKLILTICIFITIIEDKEHLLIQLVEYCFCY